MKLEDIGFYTLSDKRAKESCINSPMWRCEMILTDACNFCCPYCRPLRDDCKGTMPLDRALYVLEQWTSQGLKNVRFSGGEPTLYKNLTKLISFCKENGVEKIAISSNGSAPTSKYKELIGAGANDFSISLDACCSTFADKMSGRLNVFDSILSNIQFLSEKAYTTVGVVLTSENYNQMNGVVRLADSLKVSDVRIISAAQENFLLEGILSIEQSLLDKYPILRYRANNIKNNINVRGMKETDCNTCYLMFDDSVVAGDQHFPCIIHLREGGNPLGKVGSNMRQERINYALSHNSFEDPICKVNCLDVCCAYNNKAKKLRGQNGY